MCLLQFQILSLSLSFPYSSPRPLSFSRMRMTCLCLVFKDHQVLRVAFPSIQNSAKRKSPHFSHSPPCTGLKLALLDRLQQLVATDFTIDAIRRVSHFHHQTSHHPKISTFSVVRLSFLRFVCFTVLHPFVVRGIFLRVRDIDAAL